MQPRESQEPMLCQGKQCNVSYTAQQNMKAVMYLENNDFYHLKAGKASILLGGKHFVWSHL